MLTDLWMTLFPVLGVMFISPARTLVVILLLHTPKKGATAFAYVVGMSAAMMAQGLFARIVNNSRWSTRGAARW